MITYTSNEVKYLPANNNFLNLASILFHIIPKNLLSYLTGLVVRIKWPSPLNSFVIRRFAQTFGINIGEAEFPIDQYNTIEDLFTRKLKEGARPISADVIVSPADGYLARSLPVVEGMAIQVKGLDYSIDELVTGQIENTKTSWKWFQTVYLAPHNYHRVHAPFAGKLLSIRHIPGQLWPVNVPFVLRISKLFCRNERLVFEFEMGQGKAYVVMVGAFNVGRMDTPFWPGFVTNALERQFGAEIGLRTFSQPLQVAKGDELGTFMLGSTVVIAYDSASVSQVTFKEYYGDRSVRMGEPLEQN